MPHRYLPKVGMILVDDQWMVGVPQKKNLWKITKIYKEGFGMTWGYRIKNLSTGKILTLSGFEVRKYFEPYPIQD